MIVLDENVPESQRLLLRSWGVRARQIGLDVGRAGAADEAILPLLRRLSGCTFFTRDLGFFDRHLCDDHFGLVVLRVEQNEVATFVRRFLRTLRFRTRASRMGLVACATHGGVRCWTADNPHEEWAGWEA